MIKHTFGSCCSDLDEAMRTPPNSHFRVEDSGVLYLTIGSAPTDRGLAWLDQAILYCPFCGTKLQDRDAIRVAAHGGGS